MTDIVTAGTGELQGRTVAILIEADYYEPEIAYYQFRFAEAGAEVVLLSRLWGQPSLTFAGHEYRAPLTVTTDLQEVDDATLASYSAVIVPSGYVSDRLRYTEDPLGVSPATELAGRALRTPGVVTGIICHGLWLLARTPGLIRDRRLTVHNNLVGDLLNMGGEYVDQDVVVDEDLVSARTGRHCHLFARTLIERILATPRPSVAQTGEAVASPPWPVHRSPSIRPTRPSSAVRPSAVRPNLVRPALRARDLSYPITGFRPSLTGANHV